MAVVKTIMNGPVTIRIHDDVCKNTTPEQTEAILQRIAQLGYDAQLAQHMRKLRAENESKEAKG